MLNSKKILLTMVVLAFVVGTLSGFLGGLAALGQLDGSLGKWLNNSVTKEGEYKIRQSLIEVEDESAAIEAVAKVSPVVVSIIVTKELQQYYNYYGPGLPFDFFNYPDQSPSEGSGEPTQVGGGTGFIIAEDGLIITNRHVVEDTDASYSVVLSDGETYEAQILARDPFNDLAFLKIEADDLPVADLGDSDNLKIGQTAIAIGYSLGEFANSVTKGVISGIGRDIVAGGGRRVEQLEGVIQTDAAINPGNSGGPLINLAGQVIGINTAISQSGQLVGFAIPINNAKRVITSVRENGRIIRPYLGVRYVLLNEQIAEQNNLEYDYGALIVRGDSLDQLAVMPGSPADKAGLTENDIILEINKQPINHDNTLSEELSQFGPGETVNLKIYQKGELKDLEVILEEFPS